MLSLSKRLELYKGFKRLKKWNRNPLKFYDHSEKSVYDIVYNGISVSPKSIIDINIINQSYIGDRYGDCEIKPVIAHVKGRDSLSGGMLVFYGTLERESNYIQLLGYKVLSDNVDGDLFYKIENDSEYYQLVDCSVYHARRYADKLYTDNLTYEYLYKLYELKYNIKLAINLLINARNANINNVALLNVFGLHSYQLFNYRRQLKQHIKENELHIDYTCTNVKAIINECKRCFKLPLM